jgi:hypothetical protein
MESGRVVLTPVSYEDGIYHVSVICNGVVISEDRLYVERPYSNPHGNFAMLRKRLEQDNFSCSLDPEPMGSFMATLPTAKKGEMPLEALVCARGIAKKMVGKRGGIPSYFFDDKTPGIEKSSGD